MQNMTPLRAAMFSMLSQLNVHLNNYPMVQGSLISQALPQWCSQNVSLGDS